MMKFYIVFFVILSALIMSVEAATRIEIDNKLYIDRDSIEYTKNYSGQNQASFWIKGLNDGSKRFKELEVKYKKKIWYTMNKYMVNCDAKEILISDSIDYDLQRYPIKSYEFGTYSFSAIVPESYGEYFYQIVCFAE